MKSPIVELLENKNFLKTINKGNPSYWLYDELYPFENRFTGLYIFIQSMISKNNVSFSFEELLRNFFNCFDYDYGNLQDLKSFTLFEKVSKEDFLETITENYENSKDKYDLDLSSIIEKYLFNLNNFKIYYIGKYKDWADVYNCYIGYNQNSIFVYQAGLYMDN